MKNNPGRPDDAEMDLLRGSLHALKESYVQAGWTFAGDYYWQFDKEFAAAQERASQLRHDPAIQHTFVEVSPDSQYYALFVKKK